MITANKNASGTLSRDDPDKAPLLLYGEARLDAAAVTAKDDKAWH